MHQVEKGDYNLWVGSKRMSLQNIYLMGMQSSVV